MAIAWAPRSAPGQRFGWWFDEQGLKQPHYLEMQPGPQPIGTLIVIFLPDPTENQTGKSLSPNQ
jgi:hypothetical protein